MLNPISATKNYRDADAKAVFEVYRSYIAVGFSPDEALELVKIALRAALQK